MSFYSGRLEFVVFENQDHPGYGIRDQQSGELITLVSGDMLNIGVVPALWSNSRKNMHIEIKWHVQDFNGRSYTIPAGVEIHAWMELFNPENYNYRASITRD